MPESAELIVGWEHIESAELNLERGDVSWSTEAELIASVSWLPGSATLTGRWMDLRVLEAECSKPGALRALRLGFDG